jgi:hypothetical protein
LLAVTNAVETAGHLRKFQANHGEGRAGDGELIVKAGRLAGMGRRLPA